MGLDSVELLMEVENYFGIRIPDAEAEKIYTIQIMVDSVAAHLNITNEGMELRDQMFQKLVLCIQDLGWTTQKIQLNDLVSDFIPEDNKNVWKDLKNLLKLSIPEIEIIRSGSNKISDKLKRLINWTPSYEWNQINFEQFVSAVCANNYHELIDKNNITTKYEIYVAVVGITVDKIGVDYYEVAPEKSFTTDLGID
jgi:acyl carrier protein